MPSNKKSVKKQQEETDIIQDDKEIDISVVEVKATEDISDAVEEKTYNNFDDVHKALQEIDKQLIVLNRARIQLSKLSQKFYGTLSKQLKKKSKSEKLNNKVNISGFNKPAQVPLAICKYLNLPLDTQLPRTTVTHQLYEKIKEQNLLNVDDKRVIMANKDLKELFKMESDEDQISFLNFQKYLSRAYNSEKNESVEEDEVEEVVEEYDDNEEDEIQVETKPKLDETKKVTNQSTNKAKRVI